jgi:hypothetical protein
MDVLGEQPRQRLADLGMSRLEREERAAGECQGLGRLERLDSRAAQRLSLP